MQNLASKDWLETLEGITVSAVVTALSNLIVLINNLLKESTKHKAELLAIRESVLKVQAAVLDEKKERVLAESAIIKFVHDVERKLQKILDDQPALQGTVQKWINSTVNPLQYLTAFLSAATIYLIYEVIHLNHALTVAHILH